MAVDIVIPSDLWEEDTETVITNWFVSDGATVEKDVLVAEIMTEKVQFEITAPAGGSLKILAQVDDVVSKGAVIGSIE